MRKSLLAAALLALAASAHAAPFDVSADGQEVIDKASGLIWRRCTEGMKWNGSGCEGAGLMMSHEKALLHAKEQAAASGKAWRLPTLSELLGIVDRSQPAPTIDRKAFPDTPAIQFWTSEINPKEPHRAFFVFFGTGVREHDVRMMPLHLRLVRSK
jgi:hypothetical protein